MLQALMQLLEAHRPAFKQWRPTGAGWLSVGGVVTFGRQYGAQGCWA